MTLATTPWANPQSARRVLNPHARRAGHRCDLSGFPRGCLHLLSMCTELSVDRESSESIRWSPYRPTAPRARGAVFSQNVAERREQRKLRRSLDRVLWRQLQVRHAGPVDRAISMSLLGTRWRLA